MIFVLQKAMTMMEISVLDFALLSVTQMKINVHLNLHQMAANNLLLANPRVKIVVVEYAPIKLAQLLVRQKLSTIVKDLLLQMAACKVMSVFQKRQMIKEWSALEDVLCTAILGLKFYQ